jgi:hypothetical protein
MAMYFEHLSDDPKKTRKAIRETAKAKKEVRDMFGPQHVDQSIRQAISYCWMMLPDDKKTVARLEAEIRRLVNRALKDLKEDAKAFGISLN